MKLGIVRERRTHEKRVAASPDTVKKLVGLGLDVVIERGAGLASAIQDIAYGQAGAHLVDTPGEALTDSDIVFKIRKPLGPGEEHDEVELLKEGAVLACLMEPYRDRSLFNAIAARNITCFAMELIPRITRAQTMDVLSSQANLAGYKAVIEAGAAFGRAFPMMMTAAGTVPPAKCLIMGAGVAGLQAIATARRLGAVVSATDVRPAAKENVESLGASFVAVEDDEFRQAETAGGYAREMSQAYRDKQAALIAETISRQDIVICTALVPGRSAPVLVSEDMVKAMKPGSVIVDLAVEQGGNCPLSRYGETVVEHGVTIIGRANMPSEVAVDASALFARNLLNFITPLIDTGTGLLSIDVDDEIIKGSMVTWHGAVVHPAVLEIQDAGAPGRGPDGGAA